VTPHKAPTSAKGRLDAAFKACEEAPRAYFAFCDKQAAAHTTRMMAWREANSSLIAPAGSSTQYLKAMADEDKAFMDMKRSLDEWLFAIAQLKSAIEDYKKVAGKKGSSVVAAATRAVESQTNEHRKNVAKYKQKLQVWEKQPRLRP